MVLQISDSCEPDACFVQLTHTYTAAIRRNDQALFHYGFIQEYEPPALVEQDLPDGNLYDMSSYSEEDYGASSSAVSTSLRLQCRVLTRKRSELVSIGMAITGGYST